MDTNDLIKQLTREMEEKYGNSNADSYTAPTNTNTGYVGIFENVEDAILAAKQSQKQLMELSMKKRKEIIAAMRKASLENAEKLAIMAHEETGFGRVEHKIIKNVLAAEMTPGTEDLVAQTFTGDDGMTLVELAP